MTYIQMRLDKLRSFILKIKVNSRNMDHLKALFHYLLPKHALTALASQMAEITYSRIKNRQIRRFIHKYKVNMNEAVEPNFKKYPTFNAFFIRRLKTSVRPISTADIISPVDGYISEFGNIHAGKLVQAKGKYYSVHELLAEDQCSQDFNEGSFITLYLSPQDYHRVHMPIDAILQSMTYVPGKLFSVQPTTVRMIPNLFARNERLVVFFETNIGLMAMVLVGATLVGRIGTSWHGDLSHTRKSINFNYHSQQIINTQFKKSDEMGYFKLGSTVILLFANGANMQWSPDLQTNDKVRFGQALGKII